MRNEYDVVIVGAGLSGLATALACAQRGRRVVVLEKADKVGGAAAYSNGQVWIPANPAELAAGIEDTVADGIRYVSTIAREHGHEELLDEPSMTRWLETAPLAAAYFAELGAVDWTVIEGYPDYFHPEAEGSRGSGRYLAAYFDGARLGEWRDRLVVSPHFEMGITYKQLFAQGLGQVEADASQPADYLTWGTGLVAGFLARVVAEPTVTILTGQRVTRLLGDADGVDGVESEHDGETNTFTGTVVLATSSVDWDPGLVQEFLGVDAENYGTLAPPALTGDGLRLATAAGANILRMPPGHAPMVPGFVYGDGSYSALMQHALPHCFIVDASGQRFCDDALYWELDKELLNGDARFPIHMIWDEQHHRRYGIGMIAPGDPYPHGLVTTADSFEELAAAIGLDGAVLAATAARFNEHAASGRDPDFGRGKNQTWSMAAGDPTYANPNLGPVTEPPFHAIRLVLTGNAIGLSGIDIDPQARALDANGAAIPGLFAIGSCAAFKTSGLGFNSGFPLSRGLTHAYLVAGVLDRESPPA